MTKESLIEMGLTEEQAGKVMAALNGSFVTKTRFNEVNGELTTAKATIRERDQQLENLKKSTGDVETLQKKISDLQAENAKKDQDHAAEIKAIKTANAVDAALTAAKARNNTAVKALLTGFLEKAKLSSDGTIEGLEAEIKKLAKAEETAFLFEAAEPPKQQFKGAKAAESGDQKAGAMTLEQFRALSPTERYTFSVQHPEEYKNLYGGDK